MKIIHLFFLISIALCLEGCDNDPSEIIDSKTAPLVVEGWIEDEAKPIVLITRAADLSVTTGPIDELVQRWCRVTVSDGEESEILAMKINPNFVPPIIYTSARLKGKVGHTYTLTVETDKDTITAVTTIPPVSRIDSLSISSVDTMFNVRLFANVKLELSQYYKIFTKVNEETRYYSSFLGIFSIDEYNPNKGWNVARGIHQTYEGKYTPNYITGDTVYIKFCTMDSVAFAFWKSYERSVSLQTNFFFTSTKECEGNIIGGKGYWIGYGTSFARCIIR